MGVASSPYWAFHQGGAHTAASRVPPSSPGGGSPLAPPLSGNLPLGRCHLSFRDLTGVGPPTSSPSAMESTQEKPAESSSPVPGSEEPAGLARDPDVLPPKESEGCARPLETAPKKLCGYLSKFGGKGPIRGWKSRWFFYDERKCHLYYSRTAQDANPLDSIDLSSAVFDCKADAEEGTFEIKTPSRIITLKVNGAVFSFSAGMRSQGTAGRRWVVTVNLRSSPTLISPVNPGCPGFCTFQSTFTPTSSLGSRNKTRDDGPILRIKKLSHKEMK